MPTEATNLRRVSNIAWDPTQAAHVLILAGFVLASQPEALAALRVAGVAWDDVGLPARARAARKGAASPWP